MAYPELNDGEIAQIMALFMNNEVTVVSILERSSEARELLGKIKGEHNFAILWENLEREQYALLLRLTLFANPPAVGIELPLEVLQYYLAGEQQLRVLVRNEDELAILFCCSNQQDTQRMMIDLALSGCSEFCSLERLGLIIPKYFDWQEIDTLLASYNNNPALALALGRTHLIQLYLRLKEESCCDEGRIAEFQRELAGSNLAELIQLLRLQDQTKVFDGVVLFENALEHGNLLAKITNRQDLLAVLAVLSPVQRRRLAVLLGAEKFMDCCAAAVLNESADSSLGLALSLPLPQAYAFLKPLAGSIDFTKLKPVKNPLERKFLVDGYKRFVEFYVDRKRILVFFNGAWLKRPAGEDITQGVCRILQHALAKEQGDTQDILRKSLPDIYRELPPMLVSWPQLGGVQERVCFLAMLPEASFAAHLAADDFSGIAARFGVALCEELERLAPERRNSCRSRIVATLRKEDFSKARLENSVGFLNALLCDREIDWARFSLFNLASLFARLKYTETAHYQLFEKLLDQGLVNQIRENPAYLLVFKLVLAPKCFNVLKGYYDNPKDFRRSEQVIDGFDSNDQDKIADFFISLPRAAYPYYLEATLKTIKSAQAYVDFYNSLADNQELTAWIFHQGLEFGILHEITEQKANLKLVLNILSCERFSTLLGMYPDRFEWVRDLNAFTELMRAFNRGRRAEILAFIKVNKLFGDLPEQYSASMALENAPEGEVLPETMSELAAELSKLSVEQITQRLDFLAKTRARDVNSVLKSLFLNAKIYDVAQGIHHWVLVASQEQVTAVFCHPEFRRLILRLLPCSELSNFVVGASALENSTAMSKIAQSGIFLDYIHNKEDLLNAMQGFSRYKNRILRSLAEDPDRWQQVLDSPRPSLPALWIDNFIEAALSLPLWQMLELLRSFNAKIDFETDIPKDLGAGSLEDLQQLFSCLENFKQKYSAARSQDISAGLLPKLEGLTAGREYWKILAHALKAKPDSATSIALAQMRDEDLREKHGLFINVKEVAPVLLFARDESLDKSQALHEATGNNELSAAIPNSSL